MHACVKEREGGRRERKREREQVCLHVFQWNTRRDKHAS